MERSTSHSPLSLPLSLNLTFLITIILCYLLGVYGFNLLLAVPMMCLLYIHWKECVHIVKMTALLRAEYHMAKETALKNGESMEWVNTVMTLWWSVCPKTVSRFVSDWVEPIVERFKFPVLVESLRFVTFDSGLYRPKFSDLRLLQSTSLFKKHACQDNSCSSQTFQHSVFIPATIETLTVLPVAAIKEGKSMVAFDVNFLFDVPQAALKMKAKVGSKSVSRNFNMSVESFCISGRLRIIITAKKSAPFPHIATADLSFITPPKPIMKCTCKMFKENVEVMNAPGVKQFMDKYIEMGFARLLVYPGRQHMDFTPAPCPDSEWVWLCGRGLAQGVLTMTLESVVRDVEKTSIRTAGFLDQYCKIQLGSQKCIRELNSKSLTSWTSTFSFLVRNPNEELKIKLKCKRKFRKNLTISSQAFPLVKLGIESVERTEDKASFTKAVQMSLGSLPVSLAVTYTPLSSFSLLKRNLQPTTVDSTDGGVLYVHIHAATNLIGQFLTHQSSCDPYCLVHCMNKVILTTHTIPSSHNPIWEKGVELLVPSYRSLSCHFHVYSKRVRGSELIGAAELCVNETGNWYIQHRLTLSTPKTSEPLTSPQPILYVSVVFRPVNSVSWTRESLAESHSHNHSLASCLDITTACLNPCTGTVCSRLGMSAPELAEELRNQNESRIDEDTPLMRDDSMLSINSI